MTNEASVCPTCGSDDPKKFGVDRTGTSILQSWHKPHDQTVAAPRDPQKLVEALKNCDAVLGECLKWMNWQNADTQVIQLAKEIRKGAEAALKEWEENQ